MPTADELKAAGKKVIMTAYDKIPEKPEFPSAAVSINEFIETLWGIKDDWNGIRSPIVEIKGTF